MEGAVLNPFARTMANSDGSWDFVPSGVPPSFSPRNAHSDSGSDGDSAASDAGGAMQIVTANGTFSCTLHRGLEPHRAVS